MSDQQNHSEDEIVLPGFKKIIKQLFQFFFWISSYLVLVLRRRKFLVLAGLIFGLLLGYAYYLKRPTSYKVTMIVQNNELTKKAFAEMTQQLNVLVAGNSKTKLASELNTSPQVASTILYVDTKTMNDEPLESDTSTKLRQPFKIVAGLKDDNESSTIQSLILNHLNNRPYLKLLREQQAKLYTDRIAYIDGELIKLDSLKTEYNRFIASSKVSATFYNNAFNPADIYAQSYALYNQRETTLRWLNIDKDAISLLDGFKSSSSPNSIGLIKALLIFGAVGFLITYLIAFLGETKKRVS